MTQRSTYDWVTTTSESGKFLPYYKALKWAGNKPTASDKARLDPLQAHTLISCLSAFFFIAVYSPKAFEKNEFCHLAPTANRHFTYVMLFVDVALKWRELSFWFSLKTNKSGVHEKVKKNVCQYFVEIICKLFHLVTLSIMFAVRRTTVISTLSTPIKAPIMSLHIWMHLWYSTEQTQNLGWRASAMWTRSEGLLARRKHFLEINKTKQNNLPCPCWWDPKKCCLQSRHFFETANFQKRSWE